MKNILILLFSLFSIQSYSHQMSEVENSYNKVLDLIKSESISPPIAAYIMSEASSVGFKSYKKTLNEKAYSYAFINLVKLYIPQKNEYFTGILNNFNLSKSSKKIAIELSEKRFKDKKEMFLKSTSQTYSSQGLWIPTYPTYLPALLPHWGETNTNLNYNYKNLYSQLPLIDVTSKQFLKEVEYVKKIGAKNSILRTLDQTEIAMFWAAGKGTITPPGMWTKVALNEIKKINNFYQKAFVMKAVSNSLMDAAIICWNLKYRYNLFRPITSIRQTESNWESLLVTPNFPSFTSGHSTFSAAAAIVLQNIFKSKNVLIFSEGHSDRKFLNYIEAAKEAGDSRIYGGIHYPVDNVFGLNVGFKIGCEYLQKKFHTKCSF